MTEPSPEAVQAAAEAIYTHQRNDLHGDPVWLDVESRFQEMYRDEARAALSAAWPVMEKQLREQIAQEQRGDGLPHICVCGCDRSHHLGGFAGGYYCHGGCNPRCTGYRERENQP